MLVVVFGLERFHHYVWGHKIIIHTDHKPLASIALKNMVQEPLRLARMLLKVVSYDFTIKYSSGKVVPIADCLSRVSPRPGTPVEAIDPNIHQLNQNPNASPTHLKNIKETMKDPTLRQVINIIITGCITCVFTTDIQRERNSFL